MSKTKAEPPTVGKPGKVQRVFYWLEWLSGGRVDASYEATPHVKWKGL